MVIFFNIIDEGQLNNASKIEAYFPHQEFFGMDVSSSCYWIYFPTTCCALGKWVPYLLGIVMLGMGLTITPNDFKMVFKAPRAVIIGVCLQFILCPH